MQTLSEFMTLVNAVDLGLGGIYGAKKGNQYSEQGKTRLQLTKDLARKSATAGAVNTIIRTVLSKGKHIGKNIKSGLKVGATLGGSSIVGGQLGYRNKYKNQYDKATNPESIKNTVNNTLGGYQQNRELLAKGSGYTKEQADEYLNDVAKNYNISIARGKDPNKGLAEVNKKWDRKVRSDKGKQRGKYDIRT